MTNNDSTTQQQRAIDLVGDSLHSLKAISGLLSHLPSDSDMGRLYWLLLPIQENLESALSCLNSDLEGGAK